MMTMTDEITTPATKTKMPRKKLFAMLATMVLIAGGITLTSVRVANANAEETARQCTVALKEGASATTLAAASLAATDSALVAVTSTTLPTDGGTSTAYADRPGVAAGAPVAAVAATDGVPAVAEIAAVPARLSGADLVGAATTARAALAEIVIPTTCTERDQANHIGTLATTSTVATGTLDTGVTAMTADFAVFQTEEAARIAAEIEAARIAAEIEAARVAAEAEAARVAAEAEAARVAAENAAYNARSNSSSGGSSSGGSSSGGSSSGGSSSSGGGHPSGGGQVGAGTKGGGCLTSNGMGGTKPC
jgi:uncharacterized membrane protein YgcG